MRYYLKYKLIGQEIFSYHDFRDKDEALAFIRQLHRGAVTIDGKLLNGLNNFSHIEFKRKNFIQIEENGEYMISFDEGGPNHESIESGFTPIDEDITTLLFDECKITGEHKNIHFDGDFLYIYSEKEYITPEKGLYELIDLIFSFSQENSYVKVISCESLKKHIESKDYIEIGEEDINYEKMRKLLKSKLNKIKTKYKVEILKLRKDRVEILI